MSAGHETCDNPLLPELSPRPPHVHTGYRGPLCGACSDGFGRARLLECNPCHAQGFNALYYGLILLVNAASLALTIRAAITISMGNAKPVSTARLLLSVECVVLRFRHNANEASEDVAPAAGRALQWI